MWPTTRTRGAHERRPQRALSRRALPKRSLAEFAGDVRFYLSRRPRQLPSRFFYDALGSALFEAICRLPWYRVTRAELGCCGRMRGRSCIAPTLPPVWWSSGPAAARSWRRCSAAASPGLPPGQLHLIDVSPAALAAASLALAAVVPTQVVTHEATYEEGLERIRRATPPDGRTLVAFLGSNIGNFEPDPARDAARAGAPGAAPR